MNTLTPFMKRYKSLVEQHMNITVEQLQAPSVISEAMAYSLQAGGKRIRPILVFATMESFKQDPATGMETAAALEMIHTYSLIHDDLPSMDDDDLRRGKPTNHKVFGEAFAILAGDALLTHSFAMIAEQSTITADQKVALISELARAAGAEGMVGGQVADIQGEKAALTLDELQAVHERKTGKLLQFSVVAGGILSNRPADEIARLRAFATHIGLAFQIKDDILDITGDEQEIGKPVGSDLSKEKSTYPALLGLDGAAEKLNWHLAEAKQILSTLPLSGTLLEEVADLIVSRRS